MAKNSNQAKLLGYKSMLYGAALFVLAIMQSSFFSQINLFGATPDLLLGAVLTIAMFDDGQTSAVCGIIAGFFYCALGGAVYPIYILFAFLCGYVLPSVSERVLGKNYLSFLSLALLTYGAKAFYNLIELSLNANSFNIFSAFINVVVPEFLSSMLFCSISYVIFRNLCKIFNKKSKSRRS